MYLYEMITKQGEKKKYVWYDVFIFKCVCVHRHTHRKLMSCRPWDGPGTKVRVGD